MTSIHELSTNGFEIYPNPTSNNLQIKFNNANKNTSLQIFDVFGNKMIDQQISNESISVNTSSLAPGNYFIRLNGERMICKRFVKVE